MILEKMRRKISTVVLLFAFIFVAFVVAAWLGIFTPSAPAGWAQVHTGMSRNDVLRLVGTPSVSGWPEKVVETWQRDGVISHHRLVISYGPDGQLVTSVCDGTWLRRYGWLHPRIEIR
jgi:hypothetical protein